MKFCVLLILLIPFGAFSQQNDYPLTQKTEQYHFHYLKGLVEIKGIQPSYRTTAVKQPSDLKKLLEANQLWDLKGVETVKPFLIQNFPKNLEQLGLSGKKRGFLHGMIPILLVAYQEVLSQRRFLLNMIQRYPNQYRFDPLFLKKSELSEKHHAKLSYLITHYRTDSAYLLKRRIDVIPLSIALAQCALESAWGQSRFVVEGNNLFGVWTFGSKGIVPRFRKKGLTHKVAIYDSLLDSVRDYLYKINTLRAYHRFRTYRATTQDPFKMLPGLIHYSQRKQAYLDDITQMIKLNHLRRFDHLTLKKETTLPLLD